MTGMNTRQARVVDPVLTTHAVGYTNPDRIGNIILPYATIASRGAQRIHFDKSSFRKMSTRRAPGDQYKVITIGFNKGTVSLVQDALMAVVPEEVQDEASKGPSIDLSKMAVETELDIISLGREIEIANKVMDQNEYTADSKEVLIGGDRWEDVTSNPTVVVDDAKEKIRAQTGRDPNLLTLSPQKFKGLRNNEKIKAQFKYTSSDSVTTDMLAKYFDIERVIVGKAVYLDEQDGDDAAAKDVWGTGAHLSYVAPSGNYMTPSFGYTYRLKGTPTVRKAKWLEDRDSWGHKIKEEWMAEIACREAGFLIL